MYTYVALIGRATRDPESRGEGLASLRVAVNPRNEKNDTLFIDCAFFGKRAEGVLKYVHKGDKVAIYGELVARHYNNRDGQTINTISINADGFECMDGTKTPESVSIEAPAVDESGLPF